MSTGVVVGRFQTPMLHEGHLTLLREATKEHQRLVVVIGIHPTPVSVSNPLDYPTRELMIKAVMPNAIVLPLMDDPSNDVWSTNLDRLVRTVVPFGPIVYYTGRDGFNKAYTGRATVTVVKDVLHTSATEVRLAVGSTPLGSEDFRRGCIYTSQHMYARVQPTVDIAVVRAGKVLLGRKPGADKWCFPGGFIDKSDPSSAQAAQRELMEETGLCPDLNEFKIVGGYKINDWRDTVSTSIMTTLYTVTNSTGVAVAADDLAEVGWFKPEDFIEVVSPHHQILVSAIYERIA